MTVHRVMGIETEYGISVPGHPHVNSMLTSSQVVNAYAGSVLPASRQKPRWDYDEETPLRDARGHALAALSVTMPMGHESSEDAVKRVLPVLQETARAMRNLL